MKKIIPIILGTLLLIGIGNDAFASTTGTNTTPYNNWNWTTMRDYCFGFMSSFWNNAKTQNSNTIAPNNNSTTQNSNTVTPNNNSTTQDSNTVTPNNNSTTQDSNTVTPNNNSTTWNNNFNNPSTGGNANSTPYQNWGMNCMGW